MTNDALSLFNWRFLASLLVASVVAPFAAGVVGALGVMALGARFALEDIWFISVVAAWHVGFLGWWLAAHKLQTRRFTWKWFALMGAAVGLAPVLLFYVALSIGDFSWGVTYFVMLFATCGAAGGLAFYWTWLGAARTLRLSTH